MAYCSPSFCIQLFPQRLSRKSVKAYATVPIGIMGSKSLPFLDWGSRWFSKKEGEIMNTRVTFVLFPSTTLKHLDNNTHNNFRHCRVRFSSFVRQPFSKRLYKPTTHTTTQFLDSLRQRANARNVSFRLSLRWPIYIINPGDKTKLSYYTPHRRSTTISIETYPLYY